MPTFHPPLYHTSEVITDDPTSTPFARLTFSVQPDEEHVDGVYQLWTDLPELSKSGNPLYATGEWHEINFVAIPSPSTTETEVTSADINLSSRSTPSESSSTLYAVIHISSSPAVYSYTLRQAKASGEIVWLGSDGSNGTVVVKQGEAVNEVVIEAGTWDGTLKNMEEIKWGGVAVIMDSENSSIPSIVQLPSAEAVKASLVVSVGIKPADTIPFFHLTSDARSQGSLTRNIAMAVAGSSKKTLDIPASTVLPSKSKSGTFGRSEEGSLPSAIQKALAEQSSPAYTVADAGESHVLLSSVRAERNANADLVLLSYSTSPQNVFINVPSQVDSTSPILCQIAATRRLLRAQASHPSPFDMTLQPGLVADVLRFTEMSELRVAGGDDSVWICAPGAQSVQVGEEEIGEILSNGVEAEDVAVVGDTSEIASSASAAAPSEADTELPPRASSEHESAYEAEDEDDSPPQHAKGLEGDNAASWFFRMLDSLLVRIWSWIFSPMQATVKAGERRIAGASEDAGGETEGETAVESPTADERTPLLTTPGLSRSTSSTFNSPLNSPESAFTIKAKQSLETFAKGMSGDDQHTLTKTPLINGGQAYATAGSVTVRSYTQFTFTHPPPFTFYLPADSGEWQDKVKFSQKTQMATEWSNVDVGVKGEEGGVLQVEVGEKGEKDEGEVWFVQVERL